MESLGDSGRLGRLEQQEDRADEGLGVYLGVVKGFIMKHLRSGEEDRRGRAYRAHRAYRGLGFRGLGV